MMPIGWLCQFKEVHTFDIDPLAAPLFRLRHGKKLRSVGTALTCHTQNALSDLPSLLKAHPQACIFFDNVLGQLRFTESGVQVAEKNISQIVCQNRKFDGIFKIIFVGKKMKYYTKINLSNMNIKQTSIKVMIT